MLSPSQYLTPDRGRGVAATRELLSPRGPAQLFGGEGARAGALLRPDLTGMMSPEYTSTPAAGQPVYRSPPPGYSSPLQPGYTEQQYSSPPPSQPHPGQGASWTSRAEAALNALTIWQRCEELKVVLESCPLKELGSIWQLVVDRVFMLGGGRGWGVASITRSQQPRDYNSLANFLSATGPVLSAAARLLADPYIRYEFPVSRLSPAVVRQVAVCSPALPAFLASRLSPGLQQLSLNSWEYFMVTFSVYIVQPYTPDNRLVAGESVYPLVLEDYLSYYLPCDGTAPPACPLTSSPALAPPPPQLSPAGDHHHSAQTPARKSLLRQPLSSLPAAASASSPPSRAVTSAITSSQTATDQVWRSETLLAIFSAVWLTQFSSSPGASPGLGLATGTGGDLAIPVSDTLKIVRMLIKHLHYFSNSGGPADVTPLDTLKRGTLPGVKPQLYSMFRYILTHWPHDASFRLVLETWLSFIQPWRYTDRRHASADTDPGPVSAARWQLWVADYILFYSEMLRLVLPRFFRMDLTSTRNAYMLFRISKVFSQPGVVELVRNAEAGLDRGTGQGGMPSLLQGDSFSVDHDREVVASAAKQCLAELEPGLSGHKYTAVFGNQFRQTVVELLTAADRAREAAAEMLQETPGDGKEKDAGGLASWLGWLVAGGGTQEDSQEREELRKVVQHLTQAGAGLGGVFSVAAQPGGTQAAADTGRRPGSSAGHHPASPDMVATDSGMVLTPHGRWQLVQGLVRPVVRYTGDPDTRPITQAEVVWLVRLLHQLSCQLNLRYGPQLGEVYHGAGVRAQAARLLLAPPTTFTRVTKSVVGGPATRALHRHPARLSLRWLAAKRTLVYLAAWLLLWWLLGGSTLGAGLVLVTVAALAILAIALVKHVSQPKESLLDNSDLNLDSPGPQGDKKDN